MVPDLCSNGAREVVFPIRHQLMPLGQLIATPAREAAYREGDYLSAPKTFRAASKTGVSI